MDMELIAGDFLTAELPKDKIYLTKYFENPMAIRFLVYYFAFIHHDSPSGSIIHRNFIDHTGLYCRQRVIYKWIARIKSLMSAETKARSDFDIEKVHQIRAGTFKI